MENGRRWRGVIAGVLGVLAVLLVAASLVALWARAVVIRPDPITEWATDAVAQPEVQAGLGTWMSDQIAAHVDLESDLTELLPDGLDEVAPVIAGATHEIVERTLTDVFGSEDVDDLIARIVGDAHDQALDLLRGDGLRDGITVEGNEISLNLLPLITRGLGELQSLGLMDGVELPTITADGDPSAQIDELSASLGRDLPDDFGQLVVYEGDSVSSAQQSVRSAQQAVVVARRALALVVIAALVAVAATIAIAPRHWRSTLYLALGTAATMVVMRSGVRRVVDDGPDMLRRPGARAAAETILGDAAASLLPVLGITLIIATGVTLVALLVRKQWRADLVPVAAVVVATATVAIVGFSIVGLVLGLVLGVAVLVAAHFLLDPAAGTTAGTGQGVVSTGSSSSGGEPVSS